MTTQVNRFGTPQGAGAGSVDSGGADDGTSLFTRQRAGDQRTVHVALGSLGG